MPPSLPPIITPSFLSSLRSTPHLPRHSWYFIAGVTLSVLNRPDEIPKVFECAIRGGKGSNTEGSVGEKKKKKVKETGGERGIFGGEEVEEEGEESALRIARKMREALIKAAPIGGLPKTINALQALKPSTPPSLHDPALHPTPTHRAIDLSSTPASTILHRGTRFFAHTYGKIAPRVLHQLDDCGTEDLGLLARLLYGYVLSNTKVLSGMETSFVMVAALVPMDVNAQLKGHLRGAVNHGAGVEEVRAVREVVVRICEGAGMRRVGEGEVGGWGWRGEVANLRGGGGEGEGEGVGVAGLGSAW